MNPLKLRTLLATAFVQVFDDYPSAFIPAEWANESIAILEENMVIANRVYRDFEDVIASYGDTVNTRKPGEFKAKRKNATDNVTVQANTATNVAVLLNQNFHTSFMIKDADQSKSFKDLITTYLHPAVLSIARAIDLVVGGQVHQFHANGAGGLLQMTATSAESDMLDARGVLNTNKAYETDRSLILGTKSETTLLKNANFTNANTVGDDGSAMREAHLGRKFGFDTFQAQNMPYVAPGNTVVTGSVNSAGGYVAGTTVITVQGFTAAIPTGAWLVIAGDNTPLRVVSTVGGATPTSITLNRGITQPIVNNAVVTIYTPAAVNNSGGYAAGYDGEITINSTTVAPRVGQAITFGTANPATTSVYTVIDVDGLVGITLDRPLDTAINDTDQVNLGPAGSYNLAFHKNAIALVCRPLALPLPGTGAWAGRASYNGVSMRVVITYDGNKQGHLVTVDCLMGVKVLDTNLGAVLFG